MIDILKKPNDSEVNIICEGGENIDAKVRIEPVGDKLQVWLTADKSFPEFVMLRWNQHITKHVKIMGDTWAVACANMCWRTIVPDRFMPWYFLADFGSEIVGCGVMVRPNSFVSFECDSRGVTAWFDVRCGARGVQLGGRELLIGTIVSKKYTDITPFEATCEFCKVMCEDPIFPKEPIYGFNNWYYAYGKSTGEQVRKDAALVAELCEGNENRPFMVIDDCWTKKLTAGPWLPNEKFGDMKKIADDFKNMGVRPGLWIRLLKDPEFAQGHPEYLIHADNETGGQLDPSHPAVKEYIKETVSRVKSWGYELLKYDYTSADIFKPGGTARNGMITTHGTWAFYDRTKTSAEIVLDFYKLIKETAGDMLLLGCGTISHLCAGLVEINRIGDDTSGKTWSRTRSLGVNSLAFRLPQNGTFYTIDADCVGIMGEGVPNIPWKLNVQWTKLLAYSGSPLFVSCHPDLATKEIKDDLTKYLAINSIQKDTAIPLDWQDNMNPERWLINGEEVEFDWICDSYPLLIPNFDQPN
jgi:alpha-galactosidase